MIKIRFDKEYKSFPENFEFEFEGDFIVVSGVNGVGKTHLLKAFHENGNYISIDKKEINKADILFKSFVELYQANYNAALNENSPEQFQNVKNAFKGVYERFIRLGQNQNKEVYDAGPFSRAFRKILKKLPEPYPSIDDIDKILDEFENLAEIWQPNDAFSQENLVELFYYYARKREIDAYEKNGIDKKKYVENNPPPWLRLNNTFEKLGFRYKFLDDYETNPSNKIRGGVKLFDRRTKKLVDFKIDDLSDGEKAIFALALASLRLEDEDSKIKLLVLDEYDAPLNPLLIESFFIILKDYFIDKGIKVIISTHSPVTLSYAVPYNANFYEVFDKDKETRILRNLDISEFSEMQPSFEDFYKKRKDSSLRIKELEDENNELKVLISKNSQPILFVEGLIDKKIIETAWSKLKSSTNLPFYINDPVMRHNAKDVKYSLERADVFQNENVYGLFDFDEEGYNQWNSLKKKLFLDHETNPRKCLTIKHKSNNYFALLLPLNNKSLNSQLFDKKGQHFNNKTIFPIELMFYGFDEDFNKKHYEEKDTPGGRTIFFKGDKKKFSEKIVPNLEKKYFKNFKQLFQMIESFLK
jgi:ABC-type transport system involved in cytochrome c biogenesis ATPase subunit